MKPRTLRRLAARKRLLRFLFRVPSGRGPGRERQERRVRLLAVTMVRDEAGFLPGMLRNLASQVDGIIALDDGSTDGSDRLLAAAPIVLELLRNPVDRPAYDEPGGFRRLVAAAIDHGADWLVAVDADERLEREFRLRAERVIRRGRRLGLSAFQIQVRELWDGPDRFRADGIWGVKWVPRLFRARPGIAIDDRPLHAAKAPLQGRIGGVFPLADLNLYHLRMIRRRDRESRRRRYETLDPGAGGQAGIGYAYLTDERGMVLRPLPAGRGYDE